MEKGFLHWDWGGWVDENASMLERPWFKVQGMLALADTSAEQGGFQCVPGVHRKLPEVVEASPARREPGNQGMATIAEHLDAATLARFAPAAVVCAWMPSGDDWTAAFRDAPSVRAYALRGPSDGGASGDAWATWGAVPADAHA